MHFPQCLLYLLKPLTLSKSPQMSHLNFGAKIQITLNLYSEFFILLARIKSEKLSIL